MRPHVTLIDARAEFEQANSDDAINTHEEDTLAHRATALALIAICETLDEIAGYLRKIERTS